MAQVRIRKRGKTYSCIFEAGKVDGKRKVVEKAAMEAYKAGVAVYNDFVHGNIGITSESITLKEFMTTWLDNVVALNFKANIKMPKNAPKNIVKRGCFLTTLKTESGNR
mgnify:CR=1 FL=1